MHIDDPYSLYYYSRKSVIVFADLDLIVLYKGLDELHQLGGVSAAGVASVSVAVLAGRGTGCWAGWS